MRVRTVLIIGAVAVWAGVPLQAAEKAPSATKVQEAPDPTANHYLNFWRKYFQGEWVTKVAVGEKEGREKVGTTGTWSCQLGPTKTCMLFLGTTDGKADNSAVAGYDPKTKAWKEIFFLADGSHLIQFYHATPDTLAGDPVGKVIKGEAELFYLDGRVEKADIQVKVLSRDRCEYSVSNRRIGEQKAPDLAWVYDRKKN